MRPFLFAAPNQSETVKPQSWDTTFENRDDEKGSVDKSTDQSKMLVKLKPKEKTETPAGLSRKFIDKVDHGGDPADVAVGVDGQRSESTREFYYAPGEPGLTRGALIFSSDNVVDLGLAWIDPNGKVYVVEANHGWFLITHIPGFEAESNKYEEMETSEEQTEYESWITEWALHKGWIRVRDDSVDFIVSRWEGVRSFILNMVPKDSWRSSGVNLYSVDGRLPGSFFTVFEISKAGKYEDLKKLHKNDLNAVKNRIEKNKAEKFWESGRQEIAVKFWISPENEIKETGGDYHIDVLENLDPSLYKKSEKDYLKSYKLKPKDLEEDRGEAENYIMDRFGDAGWTRGYWIENQELALELNDERVGAVLQSIVKSNPAWLLVKLLVVGQSQAIEVENGEDAISAWDKRNTQRKRIKGEFEQPAVDGPADGFEDREGDSNFSRPARVSRKDKDVRIDRLPKDKSYPSGSPEPPDAADIGMGNMLWPLASLRPFLFDASEKKEVVEVEDPKLRITYIWEYKANRSPDSVLVTFEDTFEPNNPQPLGNLQLELGATGWEVHPGSTTKDQELSALALEKLTPALKSIGDKAAKRYSTGEKDDTEAPRKYNLLEDPALEELAPDMANTEKLFTTIPKWEDDTFFADLSKADPATLTMLRQQPKSTEDNKYFSWEFISSEQQAEKAKDDAKNLGFSVGPNEDSLIVRRLPAWTKIEKEVQKLRKENAQ